MRLRREFYDLSGRDAGRQTLTGGAACRHFLLHRRRGLPALDALMAKIQAYRRKIIPLGELGDYIRAMNG